MGERLGRGMSGNPPIHGHHLGKVLSRARSLIVRFSRLVFSRTKSYWVRAAEYNSFVVKKMGSYSKEPPLLANIHHLKIVFLHETFTSEDKFSPLFSQHTPLYDALQCPDIGYYYIDQINVGIAASLCHLHSLGVAHLDLNPNNIVVDSHFCPKSRTIRSHSPQPNHQSRPTPSTKVLVFKISELAGQPWVGRG